MNNKKDLSLLEIQEIFQACDLVDNKIVIKSGLRKIMSLLKEKYSYTFLEELHAEDKEDGNVELTYTIVSRENEEDVVIMIVVKDFAETLDGIFYNAPALEAIISEHYKVKFF